MHVSNINSKKQMSGDYSQALAGLECSAQPSQVDFFKQMLPKQLQQMNQQEHPFIIFDKLRGLFFDDALDEAQISALIRADPLRSLDRILYQLTQEYSSKLDQIIEPIEEQRHSLAQKLAQTSQRLAHCIDDNEHLKMMIDRLEEEGKEVEARLNQSQDEIERSRDEVIAEVNERERLREELGKVYAVYQRSIAQNSHFKQNNALLSKQLKGLKQELHHLRMEHLESQALNRELTARVEITGRDMRALRAQNEQLKQKITQKEEFIGSFIEEYNQLQLQKEERESSVKSKGTEEQHLVETDDLKQFNFHFQVEREDSMLSDGSGHNRSLYQLQTPQMDSKFIKLQASVERHKKSQFSSGRVENTNEKEKQAQQKSEKQCIHQTNKQRKPPVPATLNKNTSVQQRKGSVKMNSASRVPKTLNRVDSRGQLSAQSQRVNNVGVVEEGLKRKVGELAGRVEELELLVGALREEGAELRERSTLLQGEYELKMDELKDELHFTRQALSTVQRQYCLASAESGAFREHIVQLEQEIEEIKEEHAQYNAELKRRCKAYLADQIATLERQAIRSIEQIQLCSLEHLPNGKQTPQGGSVTSFELKHHSDRQEHDQRDSVPSDMSPESDIYSYDKVPNHYYPAGELELDFSSKLSLTEQPQGQIYVQDHFQIGSSIGNLTERTSFANHQKNAGRQAPLTDRPRHSAAEIPAVSTPRLRLCTGQFEETISRRSGRALERVRAVEEQMQIRKERAHGIKEKVINYLERIKRDRNLQVSPSVQVTHHQPSGKCNKMVQTSTLVCQNTTSQTMTSNLKLNHREVQLSINYLPSQFLDNSTNTSHQCSTLASSLCLFSRVISIQQRINEAKVIKAPTNASKVSMYEMVEENSSQEASTPRKSHQSIPKQSMSASKEEPQRIVEQPLQTFPTLQESDNTDQISHYTFRNESPSNQASSNSPMRTEKRKSSIDPSSNSGNHYCLSHSAHECLSEVNDSSKQGSSPTDSGNGNSILNQAVIISGQCCREEEELTRCKQGTQSEYNRQDHRENVGITPWLFESRQSRALSEEELTSSIPEQLEELMHPVESARLSKFLKKHRLTLQVESKVTHDDFRKPQEIKQKIFIIGTETLFNKDYFLMSSKSLINLATGECIYFGGNNLVNKSNFMFGQSEVFLTNDRRLVVNREAKKNALRGDIEDGEWPINSYWRMKYEKQK